LSELCPKTPRNQHQKGPRKKRGIARISWDLLRWFGVSCGGKVNGIQEVARSIRVSSTKKIHHFSIPRRMRLIGMSASLKFSVVRIGTIKIPLAIPSIPPNALAATDTANSHNMKA
jgi:hypothetical protein